MNGTPIGTSTVQKARTNIRWTNILPTLLIAIVIAQLDKLGITLIMANHLFLKDMGLLGKPTLIGGLVSAFLFSYGIGTFLWGPIIDRIGARKSALIAVMLWTITLIWSGLSYSLTSLYLSRIVLGLSEGVLFSACNAFVSRWFAMSERGKAQSGWFIGTTLGGAIGGAIITPIILASGWRSSFIYVALLNFVVMVPLLIFVARDNPEEHKRVSQQELDIIHAESDLPVKPKDTGISIVKDIKYWYLVISYTCSIMFFWGWSGWYPTYLVQAKHLGFSFAGWLTALTYTGGVIAMLLVGFLSDKIKRRAPLGVIAYLLAGIGVFAGLMIPNKVIGIIVMVLAFNCQQAGSANGQALLHSFSSKNFMGSASAIMNGVANVCSALAPLTIGVLLAMHHGSFTAPLIFLGTDLLVACLATVGLMSAKY